ncbi:MAG: hypothetical protein NTW19_14410 [Planctomycetota bacterium]|nr:hypothetical protein [Planctomycetota bacterium]
MTTYPRPSPLPSGIARVTRDRLLLSAPPDRASQGILRYALGFPFQAGPRTMGIMAMRTLEATPNYGYLDGSDVILLDDLVQPRPEQVFPATRNAIEPGPAGEPPQLQLRGPMLGGFVPLGALRPDGSPHPHAGTGFGIAQSQRFPFVDDRFQWSDPQRLDMNEAYQLAYDGKSFTTRLSHRWMQKSGEPLRIGDTDWAVLTDWLSTAIPDGDDLLLPTLGAKVDRSALSVGVIRWARRGGAWTPVDYDPVEVTPGPVPEGPNPKERCPWMEPSLARDADGSLLVAARGADTFHDAGPTGSGYVLRVWRSTSPGKWETIVNVPAARLNSPVTVNVTADGSAYLVSNPYDRAFIPETDATGRGRERVALWPLNSTRTGVQSAMIVRDCLREFGPPPTLGRPDQPPEKWMADHANGVTVRLADGQWRHILCYRLCHYPRYRNYGTPPSPHNGCAVEEIVTTGPARPTWRFSE